MNPYELFFKGKRVTLMGLGLLGRGVGDAEFLARCGASVLVTDLKSEEQLSESIVRLREHKNISLHLGGHEEKDFTNCDMVIKAAGVALDSPYIAAANNADVPVYMSTALFAKFAQEIGATVVGVTGTRGKSTVAHMIFHVLQKSGRRAHLGGNIRGLSTLAILPQVQKGDVCVLELDSWQLQGFGDLKISPHIAVFTNFMPDHLNYYREDMDAYFADKANIFKFQKENDALVVGKSVEDRVRAAHPPVGIDVPSSIQEDWVLKVPGAHNRENAALASEALQALLLNEPEIKEGLESFGGVEGRLQFVREVNGVKVYNDNNATTPEATIAALTALREFSVRDKESRLILIVGGADKGSDMSGLATRINELCKAVILLEGTGTKKLIPLLDSKFMVHDSSQHTFLASAVAKAFEIARSGDTVLFSPAFASFGMFKNEYDRNDQFLTVVRSL